MIGFYLKIRQNANANVKIFSVPYESFTNLNFIEDQCLYIFESEKAQVVQLNGYTLYNIGTLVYKNVWRKKALEHIIHDLENGEPIQSIMSDTSGQFCLIAHTINNVFVITDKLASFPIFKYQDNNTIQLSNIFMLLVTQNKVTVNYQAIAEYLCFDYCFDRTFFNEIELLEIGTFYQFGPEQKSQVYHNYLTNVQFNKYRSLDVISKKAKEIMLQNFSFLSQDDQIFADITGGFDTRMIVVMLKHMKLDFATGICGEQNLHEADIAAQVAEKLGVKFYSKIKITDKDVFCNIVDKHFKITSGVPILYHSSELINYYDQISQNFDIHVTGFAGSQLWGNFLPRLGFFSSRLKHASLLEKYFKFINIFHSKLVTENSYYENIKAKITQLFNKIGSDRHDEVASFFTTSTFSKYYHGALLGTHNTIMPIYAPFLEANFAKIMIETSFKIKDNRNIQRTLITELNEELSLLMTSHGYNANIGSERNLGEKNILQNIVRGLIYDFDILLKFNRFLQRQMKSSVRLADIQRSFWIDEVKKQWSENMAIFQIIDPNKLKKHLPFDSHASKLKAKIVYLNKIIDE